MSQYQVSLISLCITLYFVDRHALIYVVDQTSVLRVSVIEFVTIFCIEYMYIELDQTRYCLLLRVK